MDLAHEARTTARMSASNADRVYLHQWGSPYPFASYAVAIRGRFVWQRPINPRTDEWAGPWKLQR